MAEFLKIKKLTVYVGEDVFYGDIPFFKALMLEAEKQKIAGCTAYKCIGGYGSEVRGKERRFLINFSDPINLPIVLEFVDRETQLEKLYPFVEEHLRHGMAEVSDVNVLVTAYVRQQIEKAAERRKNPNQKN
jgi:PII-like signaling protein